MSGICGVFSPRHPDMFSSADLTSMGKVLGRGGVTNQTFEDSARGLGVSLFHTGAFLTAGESDEPAWLEDDEAVIGLAGNLRLDLARPQHGAPAGWQTRLVKQAYLSARQQFPVSLDGVFSFFLWDRATSGLTLATDTAGSHQLYFFSDPKSGYFAFATELKALLRLGRVPREIDQEALAFYLRMGYIAAPLTILKGVSKALPFEKIYIDGEGNVDRTRYYKLPEEAKTETGRLEDWQRPIHDEITRAVERVTRSTPSVALLLSGGIDSTVMLAALHEAGASKIAALTLAYEGATDERELEYARQSAQLAGADHRIVRINSDDVTASLLSRIFREFDEPTEGFSRGPTEYFLSQEANQLGIRSGLTGLHGETTINDFSWLRYVDRLRQSGATAVSADTTERIYADLTLFFSDRSQRELMTEEVDSRAVITRIIDEFKVGVQSSSDFQTFINVDGISDRSGRVSIPGQVVPRLHTIEERSGFSDRELIEFAQNIPTVLRGAERREHTPRTLLRAAFQDSMPTLAREPVKAALPAFPWRSQAWLTDLVLRQAERTGHSGLLDQRSVEKIIRKYQIRSARRDFANVWQLFVLQTWIDFHLAGLDPFEGISPSGTSAFL